MNNRIQGKKKKKKHFPVENYLPSSANKYMLFSGVFLATELPRSIERNNYILVKF